MMVRQSIFLRSVGALLWLALVTFVSATNVAAQTKEPTLSIPKAVPFKPTCVGWPDDGGCVSTISAAIKNARANGTIYVEAGSGIADNLTVTKGVTICAAEEKDKCLQDATAGTYFRLIRKDEAKPCIRINFSPRPGKLTIKGMEIRDIADPSRSCIENTRTNAGLSSVTFDKTILEDVGLKLSGLASFKVSNTTVTYTFAGEEPPTWTISGGALVDFQSEVRFGGVDLTITDSTSTLSLTSFEYAALHIGGTGTSSIRDSRFRKAGLTITGSAIRRIEENWFDGSVISLDHEGLVHFNDNVIETDGFREPAADEASVHVDGGVNRISGNLFGSLCTGYPSEPGSSCSCTLTPAFQLSVTTADDRTSRIRRNTVCSNEPVWIGGTIGTDETVRDNCPRTYNRKVASASRKYYRNFKHPPRDELVVQLLRAGEGWDCP